MQRFTAAILIFSLSILGAFGQRSAKDAWDIGVRFLDENANGSLALRSESLSDVPAVQSVATRLREFPRAFLVRRAERFVLVNTSEAGEEILGYGTARSDALPTALRAWLETCGAARRKSVIPTPCEPVAPLVTSRRHQRMPYNLYCPHYDGSSERCVVGCVATAMEQILSSYHETYTLVDTLHGWTTEHVQVDDILPGATVDTRLVLDNYDHTEGLSEDALRADPEVDAVARLSLWLGTAARMRYGLESSGTYSYLLAEPLARAFGLPFVQYLDAYDHDPVAYWQCLAAEIQAHRPVYYAGALLTGGAHAFLIDGMDADGLFHVDWGLDGDFEGYFRLDILMPAQPAYERAAVQTYDGFFCNQEALLCSPWPVDDFHLPDTLPRTGREVEVLGLSTSLPAVQGRYTPATLTVRNGAQFALNTTYAILLSPDTLAAPTDSALIATATCLGYTGGDLDAGETRNYPLHIRIPTAGRYILSVTTDADTLLCRLPLQVDFAESARLSYTFGEDAVESISDTGIRLTHRVQCASTGGRSGHRLTYELFEGDAARTDSLLQYEHQGVQRNEYLYLAAGRDTLLTQTFECLTPGETYTLLVRENWSIVHRETFQLPVPAGIATPTADRTETSAAYDLSGRRDDGRTPLYIKGGRKRIRR